MKSNEGNKRIDHPGSLVLALLFCIFSPQILADDWQYSDVNRIVAVSDIHGAYDALITTFQQAGIINKDLAWMGGDTHLVITGDVLDRGPGSRQVMDLIMRLEREAVRAGGQVHQLLGNHEVMNLIGDVRYVADSEYVAFSKDESAQEREYWYQLYHRDQPADVDEISLRSEFDQKAPPGFFAHRRAFRGDGVYGKWLLEKPLMIVINGTAFVHGGAPPFVEEFGLAGVNGRLKEDLIKYVTALSTLEDASILSPLDRFREAPAILTGKIEAGQLDEAFIPVAKSILELRTSPLHGPKGPLWYRGTATCNRLIEGDALNRALKRIDATQIVIGHTPTRTRHVQQRMDGRVIEIDTGMLHANYQGSGNALIIVDKDVTVANQNGESDLSPIAHAESVSGGSGFIDDETLVKILTQGTIVDPPTSGETWKLVQVAAFDKTVYAYFNALSENKGFVPELAAYRLDRLLGLFMVPVTVRREIDGQQGTLQFVPAMTINERSRVTQGKGQRASCSVDKQHQAMFVFDALIANPDRSPLSMIYSDNQWQLILVDHGNSFGTQKNRPDYLKNIEIVIGDEWRSVLKELDDEKIQENLGDVLNQDRITALSKRRGILINSSDH